MIGSEFLIAYKFAWQGYCQSFYVSALWHGFSDLGAAISSVYHLLDEVYIRGLSDA